MGFPRAEGHVGQVNNITFLDRELCRETLPGAAHVRFGSKADTRVHPRYVRFTPKSGHRDSAAKCLLCAKSRHSALRQRLALFDHLVGNQQKVASDCKA
jgi:hypothetical protein